MKPPFSNVVKSLVLLIELPTCEALILPSSNIFLTKFLNVLFCISINNWEGLQFTKGYFRLLIFISINRLLNHIVFLNAFNFSWCCKNWHKVVVFAELN